MQLAPILYSKDGFKKLKEEAFNIKNIYKRFGESMFRFVGIPIKPNVYYGDESFTIRYWYLTDELAADPIENSDEIYVMQGVKIKVNIEYGESKHHIAEDSWTRESRKMKEENERLKNNG